jgi:TolB-like protein/Tfp pilus assembly protein PilF
MYTDIEGYTALTQADESVAMKLLDAHRELLRPVFAKYLGREVKTIGDAFLLEFDSALQATECAAEVQRVLRAYNEAAPKKVPVRIGIHAGDVEHRNGDVYGDAVNIASRIVQLAAGGEICISEQVYDQVHNKVPYRLLKLGPQALKNVAFRTDVYKLELPSQTSRMNEVWKQDSNRVAVLPLVNMTSDPNDEYFADGMTEEMISTLSNISGLTVISRTSTMQYKGAKKNLMDIGRELGVGTLLEGSVRKSGNRVRITIQALDAREDKHLWAQSYDRELQDIFAVQSDVATNVADALKVKLLDRESAQIKKKPTENTEAYMLYLKGRQHWNKRSEDAVHRAIQYFQLALDADPGFSLAYVGLADSWSVLQTWGFAPTSEVAPKMKHAVLKALKIDSTSAEAHATYALELALFEWKWEEAELEFKRAIELNPNYGTAHHWYSFSVLRLTRRLDEELKEAHKALELDPLAPVMSMNLGQTFYIREEYDKAIEYFEKALAIDPNFLMAHLQAASCYFESARYQKGVELIETYLPRISTEPPRTNLGLALAYGMAGRTAEARRLISEVEQVPDKEKIPPMEFAEAYSAVGETDKMFEHFDKAALQKDITVPHALVDPMYKRYRSDPRFIALKTKVGI